MPTTYTTPTMTLHELAEAFRANLISLCRRHCPQARRGQEQLQDLARTLLQLAGPAHPGTGRPRARTAIERRPP